MNFKNLSTLSAIVCFALGLVWLFVPNILLSLWGVDFSYSVGLVGRRSAALFAGIGLMFLCARNTEHSQARASLIYGFVLGCLMLASLGVYELLINQVGVGILLAVIVELALAVGFLSVLRR